jgi:hypothetical protein
MHQHHRSLGVLAAMSRMISGVLDHWRLALIAALFLSPVGPHLRWEYQYRDVYGHRAYVSCTYLGARGFITPDYIEECPIIAVIDTRSPKL